MLIGAGVQRFRNQNSQPLNTDRDETGVRGVAALCLEACQRKTLDLTLLPWDGQYRSLSWIHQV